ncbi:unnamed protein product [Meloidogyne enterolobii]|uniref:Uncharacterized protein n=1 Tax=Meloidogyne enterolobii TaxID=390850 RepID=A0ACB1AJM8_MELEN
MRISLFLVTLLTVFITSIFLTFIFLNYYTQKDKYTTSEKLHVPLIESIPNTGTVDPRVHYEKGKNGMIAKIDIDLGIIKHPKNIKKEGNIEAKI